MSNLKVPIKFAKSALLMASLLMPCAVVKSREAPLPPAPMEGSVTEGVELFEELLTTEQAAVDSVDASFLHFQVISDLLEIKGPDSAVNLPGRGTISGASTSPTPGHTSTKPTPSSKPATPATASSETVSLGQGLTLDGKTCFLEKDQFRLLSSSINPYAKHLNLAIEVKGPLLVQTHGLLALDEEDTELRVIEFEKSMHNESAHWRIVLERKANPLSQDFESTRIQVDLDFSSRQFIKHIRIHSTLKDSDGMTVAEADLQCRGIKSL